ncbi:uncharacterized protein LOC144919218 [Branchiostoma floridae x Branchiostoma belcheri]
MARPGDDDFEWDCFDFSDFSDFEDDFDEIEAAEEADHEEDDPVDGESSSTATSAAAGGGGTLACDVCGKEYKSAGWLKKHKAKEHQSSTEATQLENEPGTTNTREARETPDNTSRPAKASKTKAQRKLQVKRPASTFNKEDALKEGPQLVKSALEEAAEHPPWLLTFGTMTTPGNTAARTASEVLGTVGTAACNSFIIALCTLLWTVILAGDKSILCNAANEAMFAEYYQLCSSDGYYSLWDSFMASCGKTQCDLLYQFVTRNVFEALIRKKHSVDAPCSSAASNLDLTMSNNEEQVLRYIAGYIPHALLRRYRRFSNKTAKLYVAVLQQWKVSSVTHTHTTFLKYTKGWVDAVNRGGLFLVSDEVYVFFRVVEKVVRSTANFDRLSTGKPTGIKEDIMKNLESNFLVNKYWCSLASSITEEKTSIALLETVLSYYVSLRCRAFADAYVLVTRQRNNDGVSRKGEKSLRKTLTTNS